MTSTVHNNIVAITILCNVIWVASCNITISYTVDHYDIVAIWWRCWAIGFVNNDTANYCTCNKWPRIKSAATVFTAVMVAVCKCYTRNCERPKETLDLPMPTC